MESLGAINMIEMTTEISRTAPSQIQWHLKSRCNSSIWRPNDANAFILMSGKHLSNDHPPSISTVTTEPHVISELWQ